MPTPVTMPMLGLTMEEGTVAEWLKHEGDTVAKDEPLLTVEMDKGTVEVPSPASGVLTRIVVPTGQTVAVKTLIAEIGAPGEAASAAPQAGASAPNAASAPTPAGPAGGGGEGDQPAANQTPPPAEQPATAAASPGVTHAAGVTPDVTPVGGPSARVTSDVTPRVTPGVTPPPYPVGGGGGWRAPGATGAGGARLFASPRARMRAREQGVELASLRGTGPNGRIVEDDVLQARAAVQEAERVVATPLARRLALEHGVSIEAVRGTGPGGRVTQEDVLRAAELARSAAAPAAAAATTQAGPPAAAATQPPPQVEVPATTEAGVEPLSRVRRITAERMTQSARAVARVTLSLEADFSEAARFRQQLQPEFARLGVPKLPWDALIARAAGLALLEHPAVNAQWVEGQGLRRSSAAHVGVAVALPPEGLVVPVLRDAHARSLRELTADLLALVDRAQANRLAPTDMQGGTFTITNLGQYRIDAFTPIINPPETAILGVGRIALKPAVVEGHVEPRTLCTLSLSFDHRVVDGAPAAAFLARLAELLERPYALLGI